MSIRIRDLGLALVLATATARAPASELADFNAAVADAYSFYRSAVFYLRTGNSMVAGFELEQMRERWQRVQQQFGKKPPDAFSDDKQFVGILEDVGSRAGKALEAAGAGDGAAAGKLLAPVRETLSALRARAGVRVFSDCVDEVNAAMEALYAYRKAPPDLGDRAAVNQVKSKTAVLRYLLERCNVEASPAVRDDPEFRRIVDGAIAATESMFPALDRKDGTAVVNILRELHSFDRILYLRFG